jgi:hypothetical protein
MWGFDVDWRRLSSMTVSFKWTAISLASPILKPHHLNFRQDQRGTQALSPRQGCSLWRGIPTPICPLSNLPALNLNLILYHFEILLP